MHIDEIEVYYLVLPLIYPWRTAYGEDNDIHTVLIRMLSNGFEGWGETSPLAIPTYSPEFALSAYVLISELYGPKLINQDINTAEELLDRIKDIKGNPFSKGGIESAWWMLKAVMEGSPLHRLLGGETRNVNGGADFGVQDSFDMLLSKIQSAVDRGFSRVKLKVRPGWDLDMLRIVRSAFPKLTLHIDCNAGYSLEDLWLFKEIDDFGLAMIEQPLHYTDLIDHAKLQCKIGTPICLDELVKGIKDFHLALQLGSCKILNIKYGRVGGLSIAVQLHEIAKNAGIPCWVGSMLESSVGMGINIELATMSNFTYPGDIFDSKQYFPVDITTPRVEINSDCTFSPSQVPGTPFKPDLDLIDHYSKYKAAIKSENISQIRFISQIS